jgi:hypothetical protein
VTASSDLKNFPEKSGLGGGGLAGGLSAPQATMAASPIATGVPTSAARRAKPFTVIENFPYRLRVRRAEQNGRASVVQHVRHHIPMKADVNPSFAAAADRTGGNPANPARMWTLHCRYVRTAHAGHKRAYRRRQRPMEGRVLSDNCRCMLRSWWSYELVVTIIG